MVREYTKIQFRRDSSGNWASVNPVLLAGEIGYETDTQKFKIGTGSLDWNGLNYANRPFVGSGLNYNIDTGVVYADIDQAEFDALDARVVGLEVDPTTETYVDDQIAQLKSESENADSNLTALLDNEILNRIAGDDQLAADLAIEAATRTNEDLALQVQINTLNDGDQVDGSVAKAVRLEREAREAQDTIHTNDIARIDGLSSVNGSFREGDLNETNRASAAEGLLSDRIDQLDSSTGQDISDEEAARIAADGALGDRIDDEINDRTTADATIQAQVTKIDGAVGVTGSFRKAVNDEAVARSAADVTLQGNITTEAGARTSADSALDARLLIIEGDDQEPKSIEAQVAKEALDRANADIVIQNQIDAIEDTDTGKADLVNGKVDPSQLPDLAISQYLGEVTTAQRLALTVGQEGDWCFDTDDGVSYIVVNTPLSSSSSWKSITGANSNVVSVNGRSGVVTLTKTDFDVDHLINLSGMPAASDNLGAFSGTTIIDDSTVRAALQALETSVELKANDAELAPVAKSGAYADLTGQPTSLNDFSNDGNFIDSTGAPVQTVAGRDGDVVLVKGDVGLGNVDNTADAAKPISNATQTALNLKFNSSGVGTFGATLVDDETQADALTTLGLTAIAANNTTDVTIAAAGKSYLTLSNQELTVDAVQLASDVSGTLPLANGGTGAIDAAGARNNLGLGTAATTAATDYATAAQGTLAGSALQDLSTSSTADLSEGSNLYYTDARVRAAVSASGDLSYVSSTGVFSFTQRTDAEVTTLADASAAAVTGANLNLSSKTTDDLTEGTNEYYTEAKVDARVVAGITGKADLNSPTFTGTPAAPTAGAGTNDTQVATTAFVTAAVAAQSAADLRTALGIKSGADQTAAGAAAGEMFFNTSVNQYQVGV